jgi:hypothetical protein
MHLVGVRTDILDGSGLDSQWHERQLQVREINSRPAADEATGLEVIGSGDSVMTHEPAQAGEELADPAVVAKDGYRLQAPVLNHDIRVVVEVGTHGRQIAARLDAVRPQSFGRSDSGQLQDLGRVDGAAGHYDLGVGIGDFAIAAGCILDSDSPASFQQHPVHQRSGV